MEAKRHMSIIDIGEDLVEEQTQSIYLKYRPHRFDDVLGQNNALKGLKKRVAEGQIMKSPTYMFTGSRGCGKTTSARILAAAVNCEFSDDGNPCAKCDQCLAIMSGRMTGAVNELNAADNRGIDSIRAIIDTMPMGVAAKYKVYIIDEIHRLTIDAFNALLKTIEEPPADNIIFIFATTDPEQVIDTIRSRATQVQFRDLSDDDLYGLAKDISDKESIEVSEDDLWEIVAAGNGSARDTIGALESVSLGQPLSVTNTMHSLIEACINRDVSSGLVAIAEADADGSINYRTLIGKMFSFWRDSLIYMTNPDLVPSKSEKVEQLLEGASKMGRVAVVRNLDTISSAISQMKREGGHRILMEGAFVKMIVPSAKSQWDAVVTDIEDLREALLDEIESLKKQIAKGSVAESPWDHKSPSGKGPDPDDPWSEDESDDDEVDDLVEQDEEREDPAPPKKRDKKKSEPEPEPEQTPDEDDGVIQIDEFIEVWETLMSGYNTRWASKLKKADIEASDNGFVIVTSRPIIGKVQTRVREDLDLDVNIEFEHEE